jgi:hypothetical protein
MYKSILACDISSADVTIIATAVTLKSQWYFLLAFRDRVDAHEENADCMVQSNTNNDRPSIRNVCTRDKIMKTTAIVLCHFPIFHPSILPAIWLG